MNKKNLISRRSFTKRTIIASSAAVLPIPGITDSIFKNYDIVNRDLSVYLFSKHLQFLNYNDLSSAIKEMGFDGVDITVRPKGHVLPERVEEDLPKATEAMKSYGLSRQLLSTNVIDISNQEQKRVIEIASQLGYQYYRPNWIKYTNDEEVTTTLEYAKRKFKEMAELNRSLGISTSYHNHSGKYFGSAIWDLHLGLDELPNQFIGSQYDIMHAHIEGGKNWEVGFELILPKINTLVVKDFKWIKKGNQWTTIYTPMGEGMVDFKRYFSLLKKHKVNVPVSIHVEHDLGGAEHGGKPGIDKKEVFRRIKKDLDFVRRTWKETN